jgi:hypothetical protein
MTLKEIIYNALEWIHLSRLFIHWLWKLWFSEKLIFTYESTQRHNQEHRHPHRRENLKSHMHSSCSGQEQMVGFSEHNNEP